MLTTLRLMLSIALLGSVASAQSTACTATTPIKKQSRTTMKHRTQPVTGAPTAITVAEMLAWKAPAHVSSSAVRASNKPIDPKETQAFTLEGDVWRVVLEANDCDFHMELSAPEAGPTTDRVIVEVPDEQAFQATRQMILKQLADQAVTFPAPLMSKQIRAHVTGFAFYDGFHFSNANPQRGHDHGTASVGPLWELHPVSDIPF